RPMSETAETIRMLADLPGAHASAFGDKIAVEIEDRSLTYRELDVRATQVAGLLGQAGAKPGDRIGWLGRSTEAFFEEFFDAAEQVIAQVDRPIRLIGVGGSRPGIENYEALRDAAPAPEPTSPTDD